MRCRACDALLDNKESQWDDDTKQHDDMCYICKGIIAQSEYVGVYDVYPEDSFNDIIQVGADTNDDT